MICGLLGPAGGARRSGRSRARRSRAERPAALVKVPLSGATVHIIFREVLFSMARVVVGNLREDAKIRFLVHGAICGAVTRQELDTFGALALHLGGRLLCILAARDVFDMDDDEYEANMLDSALTFLNEAADELAEIRAKEGR